MPINIRTIALASSALLAGAAAGCATTGPSEELVSAREAYQNAKTSAAAESRPDELVDAKQALLAAEQAHEEDPGGVDEKHLAYLAQRQSELAMSRGNAAVYKTKYGQSQEKLVSSAKQYASSAKQNLNKTEEELADEREKRKKAEQLAAAAMKDLQEIAMVKEESRGYVITLSGAVLFKTGESSLLQTAQQRLQQVAAALKQQDDEKTFVIEGHTDSRGSEDYNKGLSLSRAQAVRDYLVSQGVDQSRLRARGVGEAQPIASNDTAEGRANNRRVEIIVPSAQGETQKQAQLSPPTP